MRAILGRKSLFDVLLLYSLLMFYIILSGPLIYPYIYIFFLNPYNPIRTIAAAAAYLRS